MGAGHRLEGERQASCKRNRRTVANRSASRFCGDRSSDRPEDIAARWRTRGSTSSLGMTDRAFKVAVHRLRKRFRQLVTDQIASTVDGPEAIPGELDYLIQALTASSPAFDTKQPRAWTVVRQTGKKQVSPSAVTRFTRPRQAVRRPHGRGHGLR